MSLSRECRNCASALFYERGEPMRCVRTYDPRAKRNGFPKVPKGETPCGYWRPYTEEPKVEVSVKHLEKLRNADFVILSERLEKLEASLNASMAPYDITKRLERVERKTHGNRMDWGINADRITKLEKALDGHKRNHVGTCYGAPCD